MTQAALICDIKPGGVLELTLNRPQVHNAFDDHLIETLTRLLSQYEEDPRIRVLVLRARGASFSAGADLNWMQRMVNASEADNQSDAAALAQLMYQLDHFPAPCIALVQGNAYGGGIGLLACCDWVIMQAQAELCFSETRLGLIPAVIAPYIVRALGARRTRQLFISAAPFTASQALHWGLADEIAQNSHELEQRLRFTLARLSANGPKAMAAVKDLVHMCDSHPINAGLLAHCSQRIAALRVSSEGQEGLHAFLEKRRPNWQEAPDE